MDGTFSTDVSPKFLRRCARPRSTMTGKMKQARRREISRNRRGSERGSRRNFMLSEAGEENDEGGRAREDGRTEGVEKAQWGRKEARKVSSLGPAVSRRLAILRCDIRAEKVAVSLRTLKYIQEGRENDETPRI